MAGELRALGRVASRLAFFLHIPFPPLDIFLKLPWRFPVLRSLLEYDLVGFQTVRDRRNFLQCARLLLPEAETLGQGSGRQRAAGRAQHPRRNLPDLDRRPGSSSVAPGSPTSWRTGIESAGGRAEPEGRARHRPPRLHQGHSAEARGVRKAPGAGLRRCRGPCDALPGRGSQPRGDSPATGITARPIEPLVGEINGQFTRRRWVAVPDHIYRSLAGARLPALPGRGVALGTPLKDGMNLVAEEFCATAGRSDGVLVLSEFAGAGPELQHGALLINPHDVEGVAAMLQARARNAPGPSRSTGCGGCAARSGSTTSTGGSTTSCGPLHFAGPHGVSRAWRITIPAAAAPS